MNRRIINKVAVVFLLIVVCLLLIGNASMVNAVNYLTVPEGTSSNVSDSAKTVGGMVLGAVQAIGMSVAIIILIVLGIKYMSAAPNDRAEIKKHAVVYVVGAVLLFAASTLVGIIRTFSKDALGDGSGNPQGGSPTVTPAATATVTPAGTATATPGPQATTI